MAPTIPPNIPVIDYRRQSMVLEWQPADGTWTAFDVPPAMVHGVALIRASQPNICLYARAGALQLQVGSFQYELAPDAPLVKWDRELASFGLRRRFTIESLTGDVLLNHAYWSGQGDEFFEWLTNRASQPEWRTESARRWSDGLEPAVLRAS
jgi:hypothetical protein